MTLTRDFKELVQKRVARDPAFGAALLREGIDTMLAGDVDTGKRSCATTSRRRLASRNWAKRPARRRRALSACLVRVAIRKRATCSALSDIYRRKPVLNSMLRPDHADPVREADTEVERGFVLISKPLAHVSF